VDIVAQPYELKGERDNRRLAVTRAADRYAHLRLEIPNYATRIAGSNAICGNILYYYAGAPDDRILSNTNSFEYVTACPQKDIALNDNWRM
jgi:hypothetical protein